MNNQQTTIQKPFVLKGLSLISNQPCEAKFFPASANTGIIFMVNGEIIPALYHFIDPQAHHTTNLIKNNTTIKTVEHLLGAIWGLGLDNLIIELTEAGLPFADFSGEFYTKALQKVKVKYFNQPRSYLTITEEIKIDLENDDRFAIIKPPVNDDLTVEVTTEFAGLLGTTKASFSFSDNNFDQEIAWARSFIRTPLDQDGLKWERIRKIYPLLPDDPKNSPLIVYNDQQFITPLKDPNEPAKHKILDFLGDSALLGQRIKGTFSLYKPGHSFTHQLVQEIIKRNPAV